jgi:hypothetical protein
MPAGDVLQLDENGRVAIEARNREEGSALRGEYDLLLAKIRHANREDRSFRQGGIAEPLDVCLAGRPLSHRAAGRRHRRRLCGCVLARGPRARLSARARLAAPRDRSCGAARGWPHTVPVCAPPGAPRRTRPRRLRLRPPKATNADTHQHAAGARRGGAGSWPAGRQAAGEALDPSRGGISTKIHLPSVSKSSGTPLANWGRGHVQTHPSAHGSQVRRGWLRS